MRRASKRIACAVGLALLASLPTSAQQPTGPPQVAVRTAGSEGGANLEITFQTPVPIEAIRHPAPNEILVRFINGIDAAAVQKLPEAHAAWIAGVQYGYDSVLIVFAVPVDVSLTATADGLLIESAVRQARTADIPDEPSDTQDATGLQTALLRARYLARVGEDERARDALADLARDHPDNADVTATRGDLNQRSGRWLPALSDYRMALDQRPESQFLRESYRSLLDARRPFVRAGIDWRHSAADRRWRFTTEARDYLRERVEVRLRTRSDIAEIDGVRRTDGRLRDFDGVRNQAALDFRYHRRGGDRIDALVHASRAGPGLGTAYNLFEPDATTRFEAAFMEPSWAFTEAFVQGGTVDRISVDRQQAVRGFNLTGGLGLRNYRLERDPKAQTLALRGTVSYDVYSKNPIIGFAYGVDAEYPLSVETTTQNGVTFDPLPVVDQEIHTVSLNGLYRFNNDAEVRASVGYSVDRFGGSGPSGSLTGVWPIGRDWVVTAGITQTIDFSENDDLVTVAGIQIEWRYAETPATGLRKIFE